MQKKKPIKKVQKPVEYGVWNGKDARKKGYRIMLNILFISIIYLTLSMLLAMDSLALRIVTAFMLVGMAFAYMYSNGIAYGQKDAAFGEILYTRKAEGKIIDPSDLDKSYHPAKGYYAVLIGVAPYLLLTLVFAIITKPTNYTLGALPTWLESYTRQSGTGEALAYYQTQSSMTLLSYLRIIVRAMILPFINVATKLGNDATLWVERLSPLCILLAPMGYAFGYSKGIKVRTEINTGIKIGENKKKKKARKEKRRSQQAKKPEQLV